MLKYRVGINCVPVQRARFSVWMNLMFRTLMSSNLMSSNVVWMVNNNQCSCKNALIGWFGSWQHIDIELTSNWQCIGSVIRAFWQWLDSDLWLAIHDLRFTIHDLRFAIHDLRFAICDLRFAICDLRFAICDMWYVFDAITFFSKCIPCDAMSFN
jgi:hypothetical protein